MSADEPLAIVPEPSANRSLPMSATVACIWIKLDGDTIGLDLDTVNERMQPERRQLAVLLRDLADALDAEAQEMER